MGLPVRHPRTLRNADAQAEFATLRPDAAIVAAYGLILPQPVLDAPRLGCFNVHGSLLPRWRGAAPIQRAILEGDAATGITIMAMDAGLDTGGMLLKGTVPITGTTTASTLHDALAVLGARLIVAALDGVADGRLTPEPQPADGVTYAAKLTRDDGRLVWADDAARIDRQVRALTPWPGCWFDLPAALGGERVKVLAAAPAPGAGGAAGTVLDEAMTVACGHGAIRLTRVQRPGKAAVDGPAFQRGLRLPAGASIAAGADAAGDAAPCNAGS